MVQFAALIVFLSLPIWIVLIMRLLETVYLWQVKEYRIDRVLSHLRYEGSLSLNDEFELAMRIALLTMLVVYYLSPLSLVLSTTIVLVIVYYDFRAFSDLRKMLFRKFHRPALKSPRNLLIVVGALLIMALPYVYIVWAMADLRMIPVFQNIAVQNPPQSANQVIWNMPLAIEKDGLTIISLPLLVAIYSLTVGILCDLLLGMIVAGLVFVTAPLSVIRRKLIIRQAQAKIKTLKHLRVVAVTGSYGKTTTKEILAQILATKFKTIKTEKNNNTEVGIAQTILKKITRDTRIFIAEMGAYKLGETKACAEVARPDIALITGIDEQHISLYGNFKAIIDSTLEIVDMLKPGGLVIINGDNEYCLRIAGMITARKVIYFTNYGQQSVIGSRELKKMPKATLPRDENMYISDIEEKEQGLAFTIGFHNMLEHVSTNIKARHNVGNIAAAIITASELEIDLKEVAKIVDGIEFKLPYLTSKAGVNNSILIDDGYNINPSGYYAGLDYLAKQKTQGKKWVLTQGFIELGEEREKTYKTAAEETVKNAQALMTTDLDLHIAVQELNQDFKSVFVESVFDIPLAFTRDIAAQDMVLIEGPLPKQVLDAIVKV
jgi:UDP-N-acetylmuramoyl-tripeptide--D-alanyl-D-alanine ligase